MIYDSEKILKEEDFDQSLVIDEKDVDVSKENRGSVIVGRPEFEGCIREVSKKNNTAKFRINSVGMDDYMSIISPRGLGMSYHDKFPTVYRAHSRSAEVGKAQWKKMDGDKKEWISSVEFVGQLGAETLELIDAGVIRGASIGFQPLEYPLWDESGRMMFEKDYEDLKLKAPKKLQSYYRKTLLKEFSVLGSPSLPDAEVLDRSISGMSEDTQMWVMTQYFQQQFPALTRSLNEFTSQKFVTEKMLEDKFSEISKRIETIAGGIERMSGNPIAGDGVKPSGEITISSEITISRAMLKKYNEYRAKQEFEKWVRYKKGIV